MCCVIPKTVQYVVSITDLGKNLDNFLLFKDGTALPLKAFQSSVYTFAHQHCHQWANHLCHV